MSKEIIYIFLGGGTGSALRYCIQLLMHERIVPYYFRGLQAISSVVFSSDYFTLFPERFHLPFKSSI